MSLGIPALGKGRGGVVCEISDAEPVRTAADANGASRLEGGKSKPARDLKQRGDGGLRSFGFVK